MTGFILCYIVIGFIITMDIKSTIDYVGIDYILNQIENKPKDFDFNKPSVQIVFFIIGVFFWPIVLISSFF
jgi:hypothetical protein